MAMLEIAQLVALVVVGAVVGGRFAVQPCVGPQHFVVQFLVVVELGVVLVGRRLAWQVITRSFGARSVGAAWPIVRTRTLRAAAGAAPRFAALAARLALAFALAAATASPPTPTARPVFALLTALAFAALDAWFACGTGVALFMHGGGVVEVV